MNILFVCAGNTCRSPMAEALLNRKLKEAGVTEVTTASAGTHVWPGDKAANDTAAEMARRGIDIEGRDAQQLSEQLVSHADVILTMTDGVSQAVQVLFPQVSGKVFALGDYVGETGDVDDPYGGDEHIYRVAADQIDHLLEKLMEKLA